MDAKLQQVLADVFNVPIKRISENTTAKDLESWDSLKYLQLIVALEQAYNVQFETDEVQEIKGVSDVIALLQARNVL